MVKDQAAASGPFLAESGLAAVKDNGTAVVADAAMRVWLRAEASWPVWRCECCR